MMNNKFQAQESSNGFSVMVEGTILGDGYNQTQAKTIADYCNKVQALFEADEVNDQIIFRFVSDMLPLI